MKYFIDDNNNYLGGTDGKPLSDNEVPHAPENALQKWNGTDYDPISEADLDSEKDNIAQATIESIALASAIEEFEAILIAASITVPADIKTNIKARIKSKL